MALIEVTQDVNKVEIVGPHKMVQLRSATWVEKDGVMVGSPQYSRKVIAPTDDISGEPAEVQAICNAVHTQAVKDAYTAMLAEQEASLNPAE